MTKCIMEGLNKSYGQKHALVDFSCNLTPGIYGLLGPNGAGKSTLMNIISQNLIPDSGTIRLEPEGDILRTLGYMPQQQALYEDFSARSFLYYMAGLKKIKSPGKEIEHLLEVVNLQDAAHKRMGSYSGGMKQRVLLAQALLGNPSLLLLDEPTAGLDPRERIRIRNFISEFSRDKIVLLATHVVSDIEYIASQVILLSSGKTIGIHTTGEYFAGCGRYCIVRTCQTGDRIEEDYYVVAAFYQPFCFFQYDACDFDVAFCRFVKSRSDNFCIDAACHIGYFLRTFIDQ